MNSKRIIIFNLLFTAILSFVSVNNIFFSNEKTTQEINISEKNETELNSNNFLKSPLYHQNKLRDINNFFRNTNLNNNNSFVISKVFIENVYTSKQSTTTKNAYFNWEKLVSLKQLTILNCRYNI